MDASHRGGPAGFVKVQSDTRIAFPDYAGNNHFNTLGNIFVDPRVGLLFVDFSGGSLLQVTGKASVMWNDIDLFMYPGAQRLVVVDIEEIVRLDSAVPLRWSAPRGAIRSLRLAERIRESENVTSFVFKARDDGDLPDFRAGQYLPIEIGLVGYDQPAKRTYSLSNAPGQSNYRITVKREQNGTVSRHLHDNLEIGAIVNAGSPEGEFIVQQGDRPVALVSAGVGVTPMVSMLHALVAQSTERPVYFIHGARNGAHHSLAEEVEKIAGQHSNVKLHAVYSQPRAEDRLGLNYHQHGYVDGNTLMQLIPGDDADFYLCGPPSFLAEIVAALTDGGIREERVHTETFGRAIP
jgi:ferredoxin-NADP reductase